MPTKEPYRIASAWKVQQNHSNATDATMYMSVGNVVLYTRTSAKEPYLIASVWKVQQDHSNATDATDATCP